MNKILKKLLIALLILETILNPFLNSSKTKVAFAQEEATSTGWETFNITTEADGAAFIEMYKEISDPDYKPPEREETSSTPPQCITRCLPYALIVPAYSGCMLSCQFSSGMLEPIKTTFEKAKAIIELSLEEIIANIFTVINQALSFIAGLEVVVLTYLAYPTTFKYATTPFVHSGWLVSLQIANAILVLALIYLAIKFILGMEKFGDFKSILNVIIVALILNFSLTICAFVIELSNIVTLTFLNSAVGINNTLGIENLNEFNLDAFITFASKFVTKFTPVFHNFVAFKDMGVALGILGQIISGIILTLFSIALIIVLAGIVFGFFTRVIILWILLILVPLALVISLFTSGGILKNPIMDQWIRQFSKQIVFGPVMAFFLMMTFLIMGGVSESEYVASGAINEISWIQFLMQPAIMIGLLVTGLIVTNSVSGNSMKWASDNVNKLTRWAGSVPLDQGKKVVQGIGTTISTGARTFANSKTGKNIEQWGDSATEKAKTVPIIGGVLGGIVGGTAGAMSKGVRSMRTASKKNIEANVNKEIERIKTLKNEQVVNLLQQTAGRSSTQAQALLKATIDDPVKKEQLIQLIRNKPEDEAYKLLTNLQKTAKVGGIEFKPEEINAGIMFRNTPNTDPNYLKYASVFVDKDPDGYVKHLRDKGAITSEQFREMSKDLAGELKKAGYKEGIDNLKKIIPTIEDNLTKQIEIWEGLTLSQKKKVPKEIAYTEILPNISSDIKELTNFVKARQQEIKSENRQAQVAFNVVKTLGTTSPVLDRIEKLPYFVSLGITDEIKKLKPATNTSKPTEISEVDNSEDTINTPFE